MYKPTGEVIYETTDYEMFNKLNGNRYLSDKRVSNIIESIKKVGYKKSPILVNEKYEVIDGQGRLEACKRLGIPILFVIENGIGADECVAMNTNMENWHIGDFVNFYAAQGKEDYIALLDYAEYYSDLGIIDIAMCLSDAKSKNIQKPLRDGKYHFIATEETVGCLEFISKCAACLKTLKGGQLQYMPILAGLYKMNLIDDERMGEAIRSHYGTMRGAYNADDALTELQKVYNYHKRHSEYFRDMYLVNMEKSGARYK